MNQQLIWDDDTFSRKYEEYGTMLYRYAMLIMRNRIDAEDIIQEVFYRLLQKKPEYFSDLHHEKSWLIKCTINLCIDYKRSFWKKKVVSMTDLELYCIDQNDRQLMQNVMELPEKHRCVILLYYYEGYQINQIAKILRISESAVKMRLYRSRENLKKVLEIDQS